MFGSWGGWGKEESPGDKAMALSQPPKEAASPSGAGNAKTSIHGFDPSALERAARAAKELDSSKNSKEALRVITAQEATKQKEAEAERAKYKAMQEELSIRRIAEEEQSAARTLELQTQQDRQRSDYKDKLERQRMVDQINAQRHLQDEERKKQEESLLRQEEIRRKTLEYEAQLRQQTEMARVKAEAEGRIMQERKNHDLILEKKRDEMKEMRQTVMDSITLAGKTIGEGVQGFLTDRQKLANVAGTMTVLAFGIYTAKISTSVAGKFIESRLGKPSLIRETSKTNIFQTIASPIKALKQSFGSKDAKAALKDIVLEHSVESRLQRVAISTAHTKANRAPYRHLLLHGPPGTGKTMFAKGLARESGLDYAIMTGGDVAPLGKDGVTEIHKLFDWANASTSSKGVLIFVDEADAFLRKRSAEVISEDMRNALNAFLYRTGEASHKFMVVYASNQPEQFDWAINDRIDEIVEFRLPTLDGREKMISQYITKYLHTPISGARQITVSGVDDALIRSFASLTEGFSGREISKLAIAWQAAAYGTPNTAIDAEMMNEVLRDTLKGKRQKTKWLTVEDAARLVDNSS